MEFANSDFTNGMITKSTRPLLGIITSVYDSNSSRTYRPLKVLNPKIWCQRNSRPTHSSNSANSYVLSTRHQSWSCSQVASCWVHGQFPSTLFFIFFIFLTWTNIIALVFHVLNEVKLRWGMILLNWALKCKTQYIPVSDSINLYGILAVRATDQNRIIDHQSKNYLPVLPRNRTSATHTHLERERCGVPVRPVGLL